MINRLVATIIILLSIVIAPYWIYLPLLIIAAAIYNFYWEGILLGLFVDTLYGGGFRFFPDLLPQYGILILIIVLVLLPIRENLRS